MQVKDLVLPLVAALWGCTNLVLSTTKELNRLRDVVILGHDGGHPIPPEHCKHIMENDWKPMTACIILVCFGFSAISGLSPFLLQMEESGIAAWAIALGVALYSAFMGANWIPAALKDWRAMRAANERRAEGNHLT